MALFLSAQSLYAEIGIAADLSSSIGTTNNLFGDSTDHFDVNVSNKIEIKTYPLSPIQLSFTGEQTYYRETIGLSNLLGGASLTYIPLSPESPFALYLSGSWNGRVYHQNFSGFDNNYGEVVASLGYEVTSTAAVRTGVSYKATRYINAGMSYLRDLDLFMGGNATLLGSNSLDIEAGFAKTNFLHKDNIFFEDSTAPGNLFPNVYEDWFLDWVGEGESNLWYFYWSPRISRPIGDHTGMNITFTSKVFQNYDDEVIFGFTTGFLSPWANIWDGNNIAINFKTYIVPRFIISGGAGYWDKMFLKSIEDGDYYYVDAKWREARHDWQTRVYLSAQYPIRVRGGMFAGLFLEPTINLDYTDNVSNFGLFNYSNFAVNVGLSFKI